MSDITTPTRGIATELPEDYRRCVAFHGHDCPGLAIGYRAAKAMLAGLGEGRAADEELVAIAETDACGVDAIQVLTGCTAGKGNLLCRDYGKHAFTLLDRRTGRGIRLTLKGGGAAPDPRHRELMEKLQRGTATAAEIDEFWQRHHARAREVLRRPLETLFDRKPLHQAPPPKARMEPSRPCIRCGEPTMASKLVSRAGGEICRGCLAAEEA